MTSVVDKEWTAVLSTYKHHSSTLTVDDLCTATALRPSISEQMAALEQLNRQLQIKYPFKYAFAMLKVSFIVTLVALASCYKLTIVKEEKTIMSSPSSEYAACYQQGCAGSKTTPAKYSSSYLGVLANTG